MRGKLKKLFAAVLAVLLALSFSGCSELTGLDAQALMSPPKTTADREAIYALMGGGVGDVTLVYPKYGDYRSAIISRDLDGCGTSEVVSFCANGDAGGTRLEILSERTAEGWSIRYRNDGDAPSGPIVEGSGLTALRARTEAAGGTMAIAHAPRFELTLTLPQERQETL